MKKTIIFAIILLITTSAFGQFQHKSMLGQQINWADPLSKGLVGYWLLNEGSGNIVFDLSGKGNRGVYTGTPDWQPGFYGSSVRTDDDQYITFANKATDYFTDKFTVVWIGTSVQLTADIRLFFAGQYELNGLDYDWGFYIGSDPYPVVFYVRNNVAAVVSSVSISNFVVGEKVCIVGRYDGSNVSVWWNGVKEDEDAQTGNVQSSFDFKLGHTWTSTNPRGGDVKTDVLMCYNRALNASEIAEIYPRPFGMFVKDDIAILATAAVPPPPPTGQVITIIMSSIPLFFIFTLVCLIRGRKSVK